MSFAERPAEHDDVDRGHGFVDLVGNGDIGCDDGDVLAHVERAHEFERGGSRVDEHGVAVVHQLYGRARDGLLGGHVDVHAHVLGRDGKSFVERNRSAVGAAELAGVGEGIEVAAGRDGGDAEGARDVGNLNRGVVLEHVEDGAAALVGKGMVCGGHIAPNVKEMC